ncbi:hypothetical protein HYT56_05655 [Candidatus Woesearchaeota archaeon]|nr:hypothetical protein [Candidatus Woesearchaeota archaeon]
MTIKKINSKRDDEFVAAMLRKSQETERPKPKSLYDSVNVDEIKQLTKDLLNNAPLKKRK